MAAALRKNTEQDRKSTSENKPASRDDQRDDDRDDESPSAIEDTPASEATVRIADHKIDVDVKGSTGEEDDRQRLEGDLSDLDDDELSRLQRAVLATISLRAREQDRPLQDIDKESLMVLQQAVRGELASR